MATRRALAMEAFRRVPRMSAADTLKVRDTSPMIFSPVTVVGGVSFRLSLTAFGDSELQCGFPARRCHAYTLVHLASR